jgi:hypothetical protein
MGVTSWITAGATIALVLTALVAAVFAGREYREQKRARRVDRVLALHAQFADGMIGQARARFPALMWRAGADAFGSEVCWKPTWQSIFTQNTGSTPALNDPRFLGRYPEGIPGASKSSPIADLRQVLWFLGRVRCALEKGELDEDLLISVLGWEIIWWKIFCDRLDENHAGGILLPLRKLAERLESKKDDKNDPKYMSERGYKRPADDFRQDSEYESRDEDLAKIVRTKWHGSPSPAPPSPRIPTVVSLVLVSAARSDWRGSAWRGRTPGVPGRYRAESAAFDRFGRDTIRLSRP